MRIISQRAAASDPSTPWKLFAGRESLIILSKPPEASRCCARTPNVGATAGKSVFANAFPEYFIVCCEEKPSSYALVPSRKFSSNLLFQFHQQGNDGVDDPKVKTSGVPPGGRLQSGSYSPPPPRQQMCQVKPESTRLLGECELWCQTGSRRTRPTWGV